jgi:hypothetical protein
MQSFGSLIYHKQSIWYHNQSFWYHKQSIPFYNHVDPDTTISQVDTTARDKFYQKRLKSAIFQNLKVFIFQPILMQFLEMLIL